MLTGTFTTCSSTIILEERSFSTGLQTLDVLQRVAQGTIRGATSKSSRMSLITRKNVSFRAVTVNTKSIVSENGSFSRFNDVRPLWARWLMEYKVSLKYVNALGRGRVATYMRGLIIYGTTFTIV